MRTGRALTVSRGGGGGWWCLPGGGGACLPGGGVPAWRGGACLEGGCLPGGGVPACLEGGCLPGGGGVPAWRGGACLGGWVPAWGGCLPREGGVPGQVPPPVNRITDTCKNITLAKTSFRPVIIIFGDVWRSIHSDLNRNRKRNIFYSIFIGI